jgi:hypothetical protein
MMATKWAGRPRSGLVVVVVAIMVAIVIVVASALASHLFEFLMASMGLPAVFAVSLPRNAKFFFSFMDALFATLMTISAGWRRRSQ